MPENKNTIKAKRHRERHMAAYLEEHGRAPDCACGCGEPVGFDQNGRPSTWRPGHSSRHRAPVEALAARQEGGIPIAEFRAAVQRLRAKKGLTDVQMAEAAGLRHGTYRSLMSSSRRRVVSQEYARQFFRRVAGLPCPPTPYQLERMAKLARLDLELSGQLRHGRR